MRCKLGIFEIDEKDMLNETLNQKLFDNNVELQDMRDGLSDALVELGKIDSRVVVLTADLARSVKVEAFKNKFSGRFFELGVAEQNLVTVASGMAHEGKIPIVASYAVFCPGRCWEQIRTTICINNQPVKIIGSHAGITVGADGATHQALEDIALMRVLPNMVVFSPCDAIETKKIVFAMTKISKPCYVRLPRNKTPLITTAMTPFTIGKAEIFWHTDKVIASIIATGEMVYFALQAAAKLKENKIHVRVINISTIKPLDKKCIQQEAYQSRAIITVENHQIAGGLGSAVAECLVDTFPVPIKMVGIEDKFGESGEPTELLEKYNLTVNKIIQATIDILCLKH